LSLNQAGYLMNADSEGSLEPRAATARIERADRQVASSQRWHAGSMIALGCVTLAYFAALGGLAHEAGQASALPSTILVLIPIVVVYVLLGIRRKHPPAAGRELQAIERKFGNIYMLALLPAGIATELVPHPIPAVFMGIIAAVPCFVAAWRAAHL
jgi:hypothetical protein